jgi:predicted rRNA methylase YqxC with S4 and FtsJ domains
MCGLKKVQNDLRKILTFECDAREISTNQINEKADFAFIDGWHSDDAVFSDFISCLDLCKNNAFIAFHDTFWVSNGILKIFEYLTLNKIEF